MVSEFEITDMGQLSYCLEIDFQKTKGGMLVHQSIYVTEILKKLEMRNRNYVVTAVETCIHFMKEGNVDSSQFRMLVVCLRCLCNARHDFAFNVGLMIKFMQNPGPSHMLAAKQILSYIKGTLDHGI